jgi:hypothetical protein
MRYKRGAGASEGLAPSGRKTLELAILARRFHLTRFDAGSGFVRQWGYRPAPDEAFARIEIS